MSEILLKYATFLFPTASAAEGLGRIFDFTNSLEKYNSSKDENEADLKATYLDWKAVGQDMNYAMHRYEQEK